MTFIQIWQLDAALGYTRRGCRPFRHHAFQEQNKELVRLILLRVLWRPGGF